MAWAHFNHNLFVIDHWCRWLSIEGSRMTFWYFSRSHFPKSKSLGTVFKFSASTINSEDSNQRSLLVVVLSFMFTSELESQSWVELPAKNDYSGRVASLPNMNLFVFVLLGQSRVWEAVEWTNEKPWSVVLKEVWLDLNARWEKSSVQHLCRHRRRTWKARRCHDFPRERLVGIIRTQKKNKFLTIECDYDGMTSKLLPSIRVVCYSKSYTLRKHIAISTKNVDRIQRNTAFIPVTCSIQNAFIK